MYAYTAAFDRNDYGLAAAASVLLALTAALLSFAVTRLTGRRKQDRKQDLKQGRKETQA